MLCLVIALQVWIVSAGTWVHWPSHTSYYSELAGAFQHGRISLLDSPSPRLLALPDPYDAKANRPYARHDLVLFDGQYYLTWGPVPAIITALIDWKPGDQILALLFAAGVSACVLWLLLQLRFRLHPKLGLGAALAPFFSLALGAPMLFDLGDAAIYQASILAGQFFLVAGLCAAWRGFAGERRRPSWFAAAGICWTMSAGSRFSLFPAAAVLTALAIFRLWREQSRRTLIACVAVPMAAALALAGWYNLARFHSVFEMGFQYQLAAFNQHGTPTHDLFSARFLIPNVFGYLFAPLYFDHSFPYLWASVRNDSYLTGRHSWVAVHLHMPRIYNFEPLVGIVWSQTFLILALWRLKKKKTAADPDGDSVERWMTRSLLAAALLGIAPSLTLFTSTMRFLLDAIPCCTILAALAYWRMLDNLDQKVARRVGAIVWTVVAIQCVIGVLLGICPYSGNFYSYNPDLFFRLRSAMPTIKW